MKRLADETYEYTPSDFRRSIWYHFDEPGDSLNSMFDEPDEYGCRRIVPGDRNGLLASIRDLTQADLANPEGDAAKATETQWMVYSDVVAGDAMGDTVRFSIFIRLKDGVYVCTINMCDFTFASAFDEMVGLKADIEGALNGQGTLLVR